MNQSSSSKYLLLLGGYGETGSQVAELLLQATTTDVRLGLAGRTLSKAQALADKLNQKYYSSEDKPRVGAVFADASDPASLKVALKGVDMIVVLSSTAKYTMQVAEAALDAGVDYFDIQYSTDKTVVLQELQARIESSKSIFITDGGFHPGLPAAMIRYANANMFDELHTANIGSVIHTDWKGISVGQETKAEFVGEFANTKLREYKNGKWQDVSMLSMSPMTMDFGDPVGKEYGIPIFLEELRPLPDLIPTLQETGFYMAGLNWFVDYILSPIIMLWLSIFPKRGLNILGNMLYWGLSTFPREPYITILQLEATGLVNGKEVKKSLRLSHQDGYTFTAIPIVACLLQYLDNSLPQATKQPGLYYQALVVEPKRFINDLEKMGVTVTCFDDNDHAGEATTNK